MADVYLKYNDYTMIRKDETAEENKSFMYLDAIEEEIKMATEDKDRAQEWLDGVKAQKAEAVRLGIKSQLTTLEDKENENA